MDSGRPTPPGTAGRRHGRGLAALLALLGLALAALLVSQLWQPAPPKTVVMSSGAADGAFHAYALRYREILARDGVDLVLRPSSGAVENLQRLRARDGGVLVALLQGGTIPNGAAEAEIGSLGGVFYEAVWVFSAAAPRVPTMSVRWPACAWPSVATAAAPSRPSSSSRRMRPPSSNCCARRTSG
jgi:hypothetical protein